MLDLNYALRRQLGQMQAPPQPGQGRTAQRSEKGRVTGFRQRPQIAECTGAALRPSAGESGNATAVPAQHHEAGQDQDRYGLDDPKERRAVQVQRLTTGLGLNEPHSRPTGGACAQSGGGGGFHDQGDGVGPGDPVGRFERVEIGQSQGRDDELTRLFRNQDPGEPFVAGELGAAQLDLGILTAFIGSDARDLGQLGPGDRAQVAGAANLEDQIDGFAGTQVRTIEPDVALETSNGTGEIGRHVSGRQRANHHRRRCTLDLKRLRRVDQPAPHLVDDGGGRYADRAWAQREKRTSVDLHEVLAPVDHPPFRSVRARQIGGPEPLDLGRSVFRLAL